MLFMYVYTKLFYPHPKILPTMGTHVKVVPVAGPGEIVGMTLTDRATTSSLGVMVMVMVDGHRGEAPRRSILGRWEDLVVTVTWRLYTCPVIK